MKLENIYYKEWFIIHKSLLNKVFIPKEFFKYKTIGNFYLFITKDLKINENEKFLLIGKAFRVDIITKNIFENFFKVSDFKKLCGNYAIIFENKLFGDNFGVQNIFYHNNKKIISSNLILIKELTREIVSKKTLKYLDIINGHYSPVNKILFFSSASEYIEFKDDKIIILNKKIFNYKKYKKLTKDERINKLLFYIKNCYTNIYNDYNKVYTTLSSGLHSRISLIMQNYFLPKELINALTLNDEVKTKLSPNCVIPKIICKKIGVKLDIFNFNDFIDNIPKNKYYYEIDNKDFLWLDNKLDYINKKENCVLRHILYEVPSNYYDNRLEYFVINNLEKEEINFEPLKKYNLDKNKECVEIIKKNIKYFKKTIKHFKENENINWRDYHYILYRPLYTGMTISNRKPLECDLIVPMNNSYIIDILMSFTKEERDYNNPNSIWLELINILNKDVLKIPLNSFTKTNLRYTKND